MDYNEFFDLLRDTSLDYVRTWKWSERVIIGEHVLDDVYLQDDITAVWYDESESPIPFYFSELKTEVKPNINWVRVLFEA